MIAYVIGVLPLNQELRDTHTRVTQTCYADDAGERENFGEIIIHFRELKVREPPQGYFPEFTKSILVVAPLNVDRAD